MDVDVAEPPNLIGGSDDDEYTTDAPLKGKAFWDAQGLAAVEGETVLQWGDPLPWQKQQKATTPQPQKTPQPPPTPRVLIAEELRPFFNADEITWAAARHADMVRMEATLHEESVEIAHEFGFLVFDPNDKPRTRKEMLRSTFRDEFLEAEKKELNMFEELDLYEEVDRPADAAVLPSKWVYVAKRQRDDSLKLAKARTVARGDKQVPFRDYDETHSPTITKTTLRWLIAVSELKGWDRAQADYKSAYLQGEPLDRDVFMEFPEGHERPGKVMRLKRAIYGMKQAGRFWYRRLRNQLVAMGFQQSKADPCLFSKIFDDGSMVLLAIYVDDTLFVGDRVAIERAYAEMANIFLIGELEPLEYLLGIEFERTPAGTFMHQRKYIRNMLATFKGYYSTHAASIPMKYNGVITKTRDKGDDDYKAGPDDLVDRHTYLSILGSISHATTTTLPQLSVALSILSGFANQPAVKHWEILVRILQYLHSHPNLGILYRRDGNQSPETFADASFACHEEYRSQLGYGITLAGGLIDWKSQKTTITAQLAPEAEYMAISEAARAVQSLVNIYESIDHLSFGISLSLPLQFWEDNEGVLAMCVSDVYTKRSKHIGIRYHFIRDLVNNGTIIIQQIAGAEQPADMLTKPLANFKFWKFSKAFGICEG